MFNLFKVLVVIAALVCIAAANPSLVGPGLVHGLGAVAVGPIGPVGPIVGVGLGHGGVLGHPHLHG